MKKPQIKILILIILLAVGFSAVSTALIINGALIFRTNEDDFDVIFTKSIIDGVDASESTISEDGKTLTFETKELSKKGEESILDFTIKNNSTQYDASVTMECIAEGENASEYYEITDTIPEIIEAKTRKIGNVTVRLKKPSVKEIHETFTCTITANAIERDTIGKEEICEYDYLTLITDENQNEEADIGDMVVICNEAFNVISKTEDSISMLAQYNLGIDYRQSSTANRVPFSEANGWEYTPGPKEIDIQSVEGNVKIYVNEYVTYLQNEIGTKNISGNLISLSELKELGCVIKDDYSYTNTGNETCANSIYASWLVNGQYWWTRSACSSSSTSVWYAHTSGRLYSYNYYGNDGIRPVITIPASLI